ncbi:MAG: LamG domain-containing protein, partial [Deltaproteobacteria bacterium]|nr:LamG domain-containing protein [Nannocystaceae bacterium]
STAAGSSGPFRDVGDAEGSSAEEAASSSGDDGDPSLLLWFTFDDDLVDGLDNSGALGGVAACAGESCPTPAAGVVGAAASFDGIDDCGLFDFVPALAPEQFTIALWARREVASPGFDSLFAKPVGDMPYNTWRLTMWSSDREGERINVHVGMIDDTGADSYAPLPFATWVHFAGTWSGTELVSYFDGQRYETIASTLIEVDDQPVFVGCDDDQVRTLVNYATATLDDVRMYDRVLDDAEIAELHALGAP